MPYNFLRKTYSLVTFGCQMNVHDSEKISGLLKQKGLVSIENPLQADIVIFNTCSVRLKAEEKFYTALGRLKKTKEKDSNKLIIVAGCTAQVSAKEIIKRAPFVDLIIGPRSLNNILKDIATLNGKRLVDTNLENDIFKEKMFDSTIDIYDRPSPVRAYVTIMEGCNNFCSYCIVPFTRGREIFRNKIQIIDEIKTLADKGYLEIILLGQNVNSYCYERYGFADLLAETARVEGIKRIRFVTSHPAFLDDKTIQVMSEYSNICSQLHLPLQSGSNVILEAMNRKYTLEYYIDRINILKHYINNISVSSDFIVGFPGEGESDFNATLEALKAVRYDQIFSFIYSPRPNTPAAEKKDDIPLLIKKERLQKLQELQRKIQIEKNREDVGKVMTVLVDGFSKKDKNILSGRTISNKVVNFEGSSDKLNRIIEIEITSASQNSLAGRIV
jgi:tRNA-2-methylthio-N6-dimethylallyladenosine synthase